MRHFTFLLLGLGMVGLLGALQAPALLAQGGNADLARLQREAGQALGQRVYVAACSGCHGLHGDGRGSGAHGFAQHPTDFTQGNYKLRSTTGDVPAPGDLERTIRVGMSGTEMVPFANVLTERSIHAVAEYIRGFSPDLADPDVKPDSDEVVQVPERRPFPSSEATIAAGKKLFEANSCTDCHGDTGEGDRDQTDDWEFPVVMVSFHTGYYKSGRTDSDLFRTIVTGMNGTTMDGYKDDLSPEETWQVVDYIRSLSRREDRGLKGLIVTVFNFFLRTQPSGFDYSNY
jgi:mono/diheme cytochrome c family protein